MLKRERTLLYGFQQERRWRRKVNANTERVYVRGDRAVSQNAHLAFELHLLPRIDPRAVHKRAIDIVCFRVARKVQLDIENADGHSRGPVPSYDRLFRAN